MLSTVTLFLTAASTGLLAGGASCAAIQGGLLAGAVSRRTRAAPEPTPAAAAEPLAPVGAFLAGKLLSHTVLGALLGVFGDALQPSPRARAVLLLAAGAMMLLFALDMLGVKSVGRLVPRPPAAFGRLARRSSRTGSLSGPGLLGLATVLIPCGVTLSVELIAVTSGSAVAGAAVMAGFVLGTAPLFAALGYVFRRTSQAFSGKLAIATGTVVLAVAVWTVTSGIQAGGWYTFRLGGTSAQAAAPAPSTSPAAGEASPTASGPVRIDASGQQIITLTVTDFYVPTEFTATAGVPTTLVLHGPDSGGCARAFTIPALGVEEIVKRDVDTKIDLGTRKAGTLRFSCADGMQTGTIDFQEASQ
jgi:sulfite exporter TauE/SafE